MWSELFKKLIKHYFSACSEHSKFLFWIPDTPVTWYVQIWHEIPFQTWFQYHTSIAPKRKLSSILHTSFSRSRTQILPYLFWQHFVMQSFKIIDMKIRLFPLAFFH